MIQEVRPIDVKPLIASRKNSCDFVVDGTHFGRGDTYTLEHKKVKYKYAITALQRWKVNEVSNSLDLTPESKTHHFYNSDNYIINATYKITTIQLNTENNTEKEDGSQMKEINFYWRGWHAPKEYSPLVAKQDSHLKRVFQWAEIPAFLRIFNGKLIVHDGTIDSIQNKARHLYMLCGTVVEEAHFMEVSSEKKSLRSRASFLLISLDDYQIFIWHGSKTFNHNKKFFENILQVLCENVSCIYNIRNRNFRITEVTEKQNDEIFLRYLSGTSEDYYTMADASFVYQHSPRLFYLNSISGEFSASEIQYTLGNEHLNAFPILQDHLHTAVQPALFLLDNNYELWLWQGWKTELTTDEQLLEFHKQRKGALETAINYWHEKHQNLETNIYFVTAGKEPLQFQNIFPFWIRRDFAKSIEIRSSEKEMFSQILFTF